MTRVLEVGQYVRGRRIVSLRSTKQRGWRATDEYGRSYYQRGPDGYPDGLHTATDLGLTLSTWPPPEHEPRKPLAAVSLRKAREIRESRPVVAEVFERDGGCVLRTRTDEWGPCFGEPRTPHHLVKQSAGGGWTADVLVTACAGHQTAIEDYPDAAEAFGLVVRRGLTVADAWGRMRRHALAVGAQEVGE